MENKTGFSSWVERYKSNESNQDDNSQQAWDEVEAMFREDPDIEEDIKQRIINRISYLRNEKEEKKKALLN
jgi:hypothetical protein